MCLQIKTAYDAQPEIRELFSEYTAMLLENDPSFEQYLVLQSYDDELQHLEAKYGLPDGRLYLAICDDVPVGCIGLRKLDGQRCEMKRLYVRPQFRGRGIAGMLVQQILADACGIGYKHMLLDTLPCLQSAVRLYRKLGFYEIPCYNNSPVETTIFMQKDL